MLGVQLRWLTCITNVQSFGQHMHSMKMSCATVPLLLWADIVKSSLLADTQLYVAGAKALADADSDDDDWDMSKSKGGIAALCCSACDQHVPPVNDAAEIYQL